jgi:DNA polymerase elongation subunit (family B)
MITFLSFNLTCKNPDLVATLEIFYRHSISNIMRFYDMPGRTSIDLMKVVQRDHKLDSYKLDHVANHFMDMHKKDVSSRYSRDLQAMARSLTNANLL